MKFHFLKTWRNNHAFILSSELLNSLKCFPHDVEPCFFFLYNTSISPSFETIDRIKKKKQHCRSRTALVYTIKGKSVRFHENFIHTFNNKYIHSSWVLVPIDTEWIMTLIRIFRSEGVLFGDKWKHKEKKLQSFTKQHSASLTHLPQRMKACKIFISNSNYQ